MSAVANVVCVGVETGAGRLGSDDGVTALFDMAGADTDLGTANGTKMILHECSYIIELNELGKSN